MSPFRIDYGPEVEAAIDRLVPAITAAAEIADRFDARWLAIALIDEDPGLAEQIERLPGGDGILLLRDQLLADLRSAMGTNPDRPNRRGGDESIPRDTDLPCRYVGRIQDHRRRRRRVPRVDR